MHRVDGTCDPADHSCPAAGACACACVQTHDALGNATFDQADRIVFRVRCRMLLPDHQSHAAAATNRKLLPSHRPHAAALERPSMHRLMAPSCRSGHHGCRPAVRKWRSSVPWTPLVAQVCSAGEDFDGEVVADRQSRNYACRFTAHEAGLHSVRTRLPVIRLLDKQERDRAVPT